MGVSTQSTWAAVDPPLVLPTSTTPWTTSRKTRSDSDKSEPVWPKRSKRKLEPSDDNLRTGRRRSRVPKRTPSEVVKSKYSSFLKFCSNFQKLIFYSSLTF